MESNNTYIISNTPISPALATQAGSSALGTPASKGNEVVSAGEVLSVRIGIPAMPVNNWKCTDATIYFYCPPVTVSEFNGKKYLWCKHFSRSFNPEGEEVVLALPRYSIVVFYYKTGSHSHAYHKYRKTLVVIQHEQMEVEVKDEVGVGETKNKQLKVVNLVPLASLISSSYDEDLAEMQTKGYAASKNKEDVNVAAYRIMKIVQKTTTILATASGIDEAIEKLKKAIEEKKKELAELEKQLEELIRQKSLSGRVVSVVK
jgi:hypothetical protein